ncbi:MAG: hypothetical protein WC023_15840 [Rhodocyclaceae bacterium]
MAERTVLQTMLGATLHISATAPETYDAAGYQSTDFVWTEVNHVEDFGNHGPRSSVTNFTAVEDGAIQKFKTTTDHGQMNVTMGHMPSDAGQAIVYTAAGSRDRYQLKAVYPLGAGEVTAETHFLDVLVTSFEFQDGTVEGLRKVAATCEVCRAAVIVDAT